MNRRRFLAAAVVALGTGWRDPLAAGPVLPGIGASPRLPGEPRHPEPRPGVTADRVLDTPAIRRKPRVAEIYDMAREIPQIFDGIFCYCRCHAGSLHHRSLLVCFETDQATGCYGCGATARVAHAAYREGRTLDQIRAACDRAFG